MNQQKKITSICVWIAIILFVLRCIISWESILEGVSAYDLFGYAGEAISAAVILSGLYEKFLWRLNPFESTPKLKKRYVGKLKSGYDHIERDASLEIKQTLLSVHVTLATNESKSKSLSASIDDILGEMQLTYCYLNTPKSEYRDRSEIHYGTATLTIANPQILEGQYYTDRKTNGDMLFTAENAQKPYSQMGKEVVECGYEKRKETQGVPERLDG